MNKMVTGTRGVITTPHRAASEAGLRILNRGGTAIDAMLAAGSVLSVVHPHMTGLGGDALWLLHDGKVRTLTGIGQTGKHLPEGEKVEERGPASVATTAGALASWGLAQKISQDEWHSTLQCSDVLEDAIFYAQSGIEVSSSQAFWQQQRLALLSELPDLSVLTYSDNGEMLKAGDKLYQPRLADTLRQLARRGLDDFYQGDIAQGLAAGFAKLNCGLTAADLAMTKAREVAPLSVRYRSGTLYNFPPPNQGLYTLQALASYAHLTPKLPRNGSAHYYHLLVECVKHALQRRNQQLADPEFISWSTSAFLTENFVQSCVEKISPSHASIWAETSEPADTVWLACTDEEGRTACLMQSLFHDFGSGCFIGDTGVLWHNRAASFSSDTAHPNAWAPGKLPAHTLNPSCYLSDGVNHFFGSQGGDGQPQTQMILATQLVDFQQDVKGALYAPRFLQGKSFFDGNETLKLEENINVEVIRQLAAQGHEVELIPSLSPLCGLAGVISNRTDQRHAMHDPRGEGVALAQRDVNVSS